MPADARLGSLADLDLHRRAGLQVARVHPEAARGALHDDVVLVGLEVGVQAALAGVHEGPQLARRRGPAPGAR